MNERRDAETVVDIGIDICRDLLTLCARGSDFGDRQGHFVPVLFTSRFEVKDVDRSLARAPDIQRFVDRFQQAVAFVAHVSVIATTILAGNFAQRCDLFGPGVNGRWIDQSCGNTDRSSLHAFANQFSHSMEFIIARSSVNFAKNKFSHLSMPH